MAEALPGIERPSLQALPQIGDRMTFLYLEHCQLNREDGAILIRDERGTAAVPAAAVSVLLLGPGTNVTHRAMELIGDTGVSVVWVTCVAMNASIRAQNSGRFSSLSVRPEYSAISFNVGEK